jgi:hypothetical protein
MPEQPNTAGQAKQPLMTVTLHVFDDCVRTQIGLELGTSAEQASDGLRRASEQLSVFIPTERADSYLDKLKPVAALFDEIDPAERDDTLYFRREALTHGPGVFSYGDIRRAKALLDSVTSSSPREAEPTPP